MDDEEYGGMAAATLAVMTGLAFGLGMLAGWALHWVL